VRGLLTLTAVLETGAGLALLAIPEFVVDLIMGSGVEGPPALAIARIAGAALFALGVACWFARGDQGSAAGLGLAKAMALYNLGVVLVLVAAGLQAGTVGILLWPAVIIHAGMAAWCVLAVIRKPV
jgi:hypothetical protein